MTAAAPVGSLSELNAALDAGRTTSVALLETAFARADAVEDTLRSLLHPRREAALAEAAAADERRREGRALSPLDGIPLVIKDNIVQAGEPATCASRMLESYRSPFSATAVARLQAAGAVIMARSNMDEFAMGSSTENSVHGASRNPWNTAHAPGGSSGGSAAAMAAGIAPLALGSDTGGSIRQPAAFCGIVGMKPTYGRVSRFGLVAFASSLDQVGPMGRSAADCAALLDVISGADPRDSTTLPEPAPASRKALEEGGAASELRIGLPRELARLAGVDPGVLGCVETALAEYEAAGAEVREVSLPRLRHGIAAYYLVCTAEASSNLARFDGVRYGHRAHTEGGGVDDMYEASRSEGFGDEVKRRVLLGTFVLSAGYYDAYYRKAQQLRTLLRRDFDAAFADCDVIALPTTPETAFALGERDRDPLSMYRADLFTVVANLAGLPAISLPCGFQGGLPVGLQLLGPPLADTLVLRAAHAYQQRTDHHLQRPPL